VINLWIGSFGAITFGFRMWKRRIKAKSNQLSLVKLPCVQIYYMTLIDVSISFETNT